MRYKRVIVEVPATTANMGPGFDCMGMALDIWNRVEVEVGQGPRVCVDGEGAERLSRGPANLVYRSISSTLERIGEQAPPMVLRCHNEIPLARGLGSSAAAVVGGLLAANALCDSPLSESGLLSMATSIEGHPDNVTPALMGGCRIVARDGDSLVTMSVPLPLELRAVLFIPDMPMPTARARALLPRRVEREDAVYNMARVAMLATALATGQVEYLGIATQDRLHQPAREHLLPQMGMLFRVAREAGALGVFLSGAGSTILALTRGREATVASEMADMADKLGLPGRVKVAVPSLQGAHVVTKE